MSSSLGHFLMTFDYRDRLFHDQNSLGLSVFIALTSTYFVSLQQYFNAASVVLMWGFLKLVWDLVWERHELHWKVRYVPLALAVRSYIHSTYHMVVLLRTFFGIFGRERCPDDDDALKRFACPSLESRYYGIFNLKRLVCRNLSSTP
jgi:hypothetical protein